MSEPGIDLRNPDLYAGGDYHAVFTKLRHECPVYWNAGADGSGFWAITKYEDVVTVSKDPKLFSSARERGGHRIFDENVVSVGASRSNDSLDASMISMDPPGHARYRKMVTPGFTPPRIQALEERVRRRVTDVLDRIAPLGECEFVSSVAAELPIQVLAELFGVPQEDRRRLFEWSNAVIGEDDPELRSSQEHIDACIEAMARYSANLWQERLEHPGDDLISMLAHARVDGEPMTMQRYLATFILLVVAGNETTRNSLSGGLIALSENPGERRKLIDDPSLLPKAANEIVRWVSPVLHMRRTATDDTEIRGQKIRAGDRVVVWYCSANRDEEVFDEPFRFDVTRETPHLGFGIGQHFCLGSRLAELQLRVAFGELLGRFPDIVPAGPVRRLRSNFLAGIKSMPVRFTREG
ncbi:MAG: cytochrome P450 [Candidatus Binatia bacterium]